MKLSRIQLDDTFALFSDSVSTFAAEKGLRLDKCPRDNSGWELVGDHHVGGTIYLLMMYDTDRGLGIGSVWQFPCEEMSLLYSHFRAIAPCDTDPLQIVETLRNEWREINSVKFGYWTHLVPLQVAQ